MAKAKTPNAAEAASPEVHSSADTTVEAPAPRKRGRPLGSKNKPKAKVRAKAEKQEATAVVVPAHIPLEDLPLGALRMRAKTIYNIPGVEDMEKEDLLNAILRRQRGKEFALAAPEGDQIPAGYAKIELFKSSDPKASRRPQFVGVNGLNYMIPLGIPVNVPIKIYEVLNNAVERVIEEDNSTNGSANSQFRYSERHRIPFRVYGVTPGPDPKPRNQRERVAKSRPREEYADLFGRYPTNAMLLEAVKDGVIKLIR